MNFDDPAGLFVMLMTALVVSVLQVGICVGAMYGIHKWPALAEKVGETGTYGDFSLDQFQKPAFMNLLTRLAIIFGGATIVLHVAAFLLVGRYSWRYPYSIAFGLFVFEVAAMAAGLHFLLKVEEKKNLALTVASGVGYLVLLWLVLFSKLR